MRQFSFCLAFLVAAALFPTSAHAGTIYTANLDGPSESPPNNSPGTGFAMVDWDTTAHTMHVMVTFSGLVAGTTASHIHAATALPGEGTAQVATQVPTFMGFPLGVMSGTYDHMFNTLDDATWNPAYLNSDGGGTAAGAEAAMDKALAEGKAYYNIHSTTFPGGEIRGFLQQVPEPASLTLLGIGLAGMAGYAWRRRKPALA